MAIDDSSGSSFLPSTPSAVRPPPQLHFTSGINDVEQSIELASTALHIATGYFFDLYGEPYVQRMGFKHTGYLRPGGALVMKVYEGAG